MGIRDVALGVEKVQSLKLLADLGVDGYQWFVTGPMTELL